MVEALRELRKYEEALNGQWLKNAQGKAVSNHKASGKLWAGAWVIIAGPTEVWHLSLVSRTREARVGDPRLPPAHWLAGMHASVARLLLYKTWT